MPPRVLVSRLQSPEARKLQRAARDDRPRLYAFETLARDTGHKVRLIAFVQSVEKAIRDVVSRKRLLVAESGRTSPSAISRSNAA